MSVSVKRRDFIKSAAAIGMSAVVGPGLVGTIMPEELRGQVVRPVVISSANGMKATARAMEMIQQGSDAPAEHEGVPVSGVIGHRRAMLVRVLVYFLLALLIVAVLAPLYV